MARWRRTERTRRPLPALALALSSLLPAAHAASAAEPAASSDTRLAFARRGEAVATLDVAALRRLAEPATLRVHEPYEDGEAEFEALPLSAILDGVYGRSWRDEEELLFTCRDGYQPTVPVARVAAHRAWLAFRRIGTPGFTILKRESGVLRTVDLGPFYLIWENLDDEQVLVEGDYGWPYQLVSIDLIRSAERFPKLAPPSGAAPSVRAGFAAFRIHCSKCHALNGEGGRIGPELNAPGAPLADREPAWLRTWIESPERIRPNSRMPALNPRLPDRARVVDDLIAYLDAMVGPKAH